jgi:hypothetical protein
LKLRFALAAILLAVCCAASASPLIRTSTFASDPVWKDGKSEVTTYIQTGGSLSGSHQLFTLHLQESPESHFPNGSFEWVILRDRLVGRDTTRERISLLLDRTLSRCGNRMWLSDTLHTVEVYVDGDRTRYRWPSESAGDTVEVKAQRPQTRLRDPDWPVPGTTYYEALPAWLRGLELEIPSRDSVRMIPPQSLDDMTREYPIPAEIEVIGPAGPPSQTSHGGLQVNVHYAGKVDRMWFHPGPGHILLVWERADGTTLTYLKSERRVFE